MSHEHHLPGPPDPLTGLPAPSTGQDGALPAEPRNDAAERRSVAGADQRPAVGYGLYLLASLLFGINGTVS